MDLKEKIKSGKSICGTLVNLPSVCVTEMLGYFDFDYLWIDLEHSAINIETCYNMLVAAKSVRRHAIVRVPQNDLTYTKKVLEMGPDGIIFPMVQNAKEAEELLSYTLYPPYGTRGCGPQRAVRYGFDSEYEYLRMALQIYVDFCRLSAKPLLMNLNKLLIIHISMGLF